MGDSANVAACPTCGGSWLAVAYGGGPPPPGLRLESAGSSLVLRGDARTAKIGPIVAALLVAFAIRAFTLGNAFPLRFFVGAALGIAALVAIHASAVARLNTIRFRFGSNELSISSGPLPNLLTPIRLPLADVLGFVVEEERDDRGILCVRSTDGRLTRIDLPLTIAEAQHLAGRLEALREDVSRGEPQVPYRERSRVALEPEPEPIETEGEEAGEGAAGRSSR